VLQAVFAIRPPGQARARPPQADGRRGHPAAVAAATVPVAHHHTSDRGHHSYDHRCHLTGHQARVQRRDGRPMWLFRRRACELSTETVYTTPPYADTLNTKFDLPAVLISIFHHQ